MIWASSQTASSRPSISIRNFCAQGTEQERVLSFVKVLRVVPIFETAAGSKDTNTGPPWAGCKFASLEPGLRDVSEQVKENLKADSFCEVLLRRDSTVTGGDGRRL